MLLLKRIRTQVILFFLIITSVYCFAQTSDKDSIPKKTYSGETYAIIIGISDYLEVPDLQFADKDAKAFANYIKSKSGGSVDSVNIKIFLNEEATAINIGDAFLWLSRICMSGDRVYIYFAGHGDVEALNDIENGLLLLYKAPVSSYFAFGNDYLPVYEIKKFLKTLTNKKVNVILITDACRSGKLAGGIEGSEKTSKALSENWSGEIKILSCQPNQLSQEGQQWGNGRGVFSYHLIEGLQGLADTNNNNRVCLAEIEKYLVSIVPEETAPARQIPFVIGERSVVIAEVDNETLTALKKQKESEYKLLKTVNIKGFENNLLSSCDSLVIQNYKYFLKTLKEGNVISPKGESAYDYYLLLSEKEDIDDILNLMKRNLAAALQDDALQIIVPLLKGETVATDIESLITAKNELKIAIGLLDKNHYIISSLKARKLFLEASIFVFVNESINNDSVLTEKLINNAIKKLKQSIELEPNAAYSYYELGFVYDARKKFRKALKEYKKYLEFVPNNAAAYNNIASIYYELKEYKLAVIYCSQALELKPDFPAPYINLGNIYNELKEYDKAVYCFKKAMALSQHGKNKRGLARLIKKQDSKALYTIGHTYKTNKNYKKALFYYRKALTEQLKEKVFLFVQKQF